MKKTLLLVLFVGMIAPAVTLNAETCFSCGRESKGACQGAQQCRGTRDSCTKSGCKISGTSSCSTAANVKICAAAKPDQTRQFAWMSK